MHSGPHTRVLLSQAHLKSAFNIIFVYKLGILLIPLWEQGLRISVVVTGNVGGTADNQQLLFKGSHHHAEITFNTNDLLSLDTISVSPAKKTWLPAVSDWVVTELVAEVNCCFVLFKKRTKLFLAVWMNGKLWLDRKVALFNPLKCPLISGSDPE